MKTSLHGRHHDRIAAGRFARRDEIAEIAEFFSFGTNDLTQTVMGLSRDDAGRFLPDYVDEKKAGIFPGDPFQTLDIKGVGMMVRMGIEKGQKTRPNLKIGICGEHGGDAGKRQFCHQVGMDYVSASPFRVLIAPLGGGSSCSGREEGREEQAQVTRRVAYPMRSLHRVGLNHIKQPSECGRIAAAVAIKISWLRVYFRPWPHKGNGSKPLTLASLCSMVCEFVATVCPASRGVFGTADTPLTLRGGA